MRGLLALALTALLLAPAVAAEPVGDQSAGGWPDCRGLVDTNCYDANSRIPFCYLYVVVLCIPDPI